MLEVDSGSPLVPYRERQVAAAMRHYRDHGAGAGHDLTGREATATAPCSFARTRGRDDEATARLRDRD